MGAEPHADPVDGAVTLYRPTGEAELRLVEASGWRAFPPRLPGQPIFYPVLEVAYATEIARDWNTKDARSGFVGHVLRFRVRQTFLARYEMHQVGGRVHREYWIPADDLGEFNQNIVGKIELVATYR